MRKLAFFISFFGFLIPLLAQNPKSFMRNYSPREYRGESQSWCTVQDLRGLMYFANNAGVLEYDGVDWQIIPVNNESTVRSLALGKNGKIYVGAENEIGFLDTDVSGKTKYVSLLHLLPEDKRNFGTVWSTVAKDDEIYFQCNHQIFRLKNNKLTIWEVADTYHRLFLVDNKIYVRQDGIGMTVLQKSGFEPAPHARFFDKKIISVFLPYQKGSYLVGIRNEGFFIYDPASPTPPQAFVTEIDEEIKIGNLYHGIVSNGLFVFMTTRSGVYIIDKNGKLIQTISQKNGLQAEGGYYLFEDKAKNLWLTLSNGITRTEVNSPISFWDKNSGLRGLVTSITYFQNKIYAVTGFGLYFIENNQLYNVEGTDTQGWCLLNFKPKNEDKEILLAGFGEKIQEIKDNKATEIYHYAKNNNAYQLYASKKYPNLVWVGEDNGLAALEYQNKKWNYRSIKNLPADIRNIAETKEGHLWLGTSSEGVFSVKFLTNKPDTAVVFQYDTAHGLPSLKNNTPVEIGNEIFFGTQEGLYRFDKSSEKFVKHGILGTQNAKKNIYSLHEDQNKNLWIGGLNSSTSPMGVAYYQRGAYKWEDRPFRKIPQMLETVITTSPDGAVWIGGSEGLFRFDASLQKNYMGEYLTLIRKVSVEDSVIFYGNFFEKDQIISHQKQTLQLSHKENSLTFHYASPSFEDEQSVVYRHILEGYDQHWSAWSKETKKEYTNLPTRKFTFKVQARNIYDKESQESSFLFVISPPWYLHKLAFLSYGIFAFMLVWGLIRFNIRRLEKEKNNLEFLVQARTAEISKQNQILEQQKQEITTQRDDITRQKHEIEKAYLDIETISEIGQKITATLDFDKMLDTLYKNINSLIDAAVFGVGVFEEDQQVIVFKGFIENGEKHPTIVESVHDEKRFSAWCFQNQKPVVINDFENEYKNYLKVDYKMIDGLPQSLIYLPLVIENEPIGVITVQSFEKNSYERFDITILQTLASYVAVALENSKSYEIITENNRKITDSIRYAKSIQQAILPSNQELKEAFSEYFVIFRPKDIVSGDFYWFSNISPQHYFLAVIDCTGHGVPGAFMSMVGSDLLNEIITIKRILDPAQVLENLNIRIRESLRQESRANDDGMDASLCFFQKQDDHITVQFAGAKQTVHYYSILQKELFELKGNNKSIGGWQKSKRHFDTKTVVLQKNDTIYLSSDGIIDQPNAEKQKFGSQNYKRLLKDAANLPLEEQKTMILKVLELHAVKEAQRDDITVIGIQC